MARVTAMVCTSHVPAMGMAIDQGRTTEPCWAPVFAGYEASRRWFADDPPDAIVLVYNDHASAFGPELVPTFALGMGECFAPADEGWGPRPVPVVPGHPELAAHIAQCVIEDDFDLTLVQHMDVDHGLTVPLSLLCGQPPAHDFRWPCPVIPLAVNVIQHPLPSGRRCLALGHSLGRAIARFPGDLKVQVWGTGGMSHQLQGPRAGLINPVFDHAFMDMLTTVPQAAAAISPVDFVREAGSEGVELVMWLIARGALPENPQNRAPNCLQRFYHVPASTTAVGHLVLTP
jgi:protocatechuate 4,5-dioxygenase beta chain